MDGTRRDASSAIDVETTRETDVAVEARLETVVSVLVVTKMMIE
jgi:hypothetical protein